MIEITQAIGRETAHIYVVENTRDDLLDFEKWLDAQSGKKLAVDTETTGLDIFDEHFKVRTIQIGVSLTAWVIPVDDLDLGDRISSWLDGKEITLHNAAYDLLALRRCFGWRANWDIVSDTRIYAHLLDPRPAREGGVGHSLQELTAKYVDAEVAENVKGSMNAMAKEAGVKKAEVFAEIDTFNKTYLLYAGMDVVLTWVLERILGAKLKNLKMEIPEFDLGLIRYEHEVARVCAEMEYNGFLLDVEYAQKKSQELREEFEAWSFIAENEYGVDSVNAAEQVADALLDTGVKLSERTDTGRWKVNKDVLDPLVEQGHELAIAVQSAKKATKWDKSWVSKFLEGRDSNDRVHANINPLMARTARMSITGIPAQTLPSSDWTIRRCFIAEPGHSIIACDYQSQELRVLAALSQDKTMIKAFREDADLHQLTADASGVERSVGKTVNFAYVYGSGAGNIANTTGISVQKAREVIRGFETTYPGVKALSKKLQEKAKQDGYIVTVKGRVLPVDPERPYAALNYMIQSTSRDITAEALLRLDKAGLTPYLRLPIHDEVILSVPEEYAERAAQVVSGYMETQLNGVVIGSDNEVYGKSWGGGYVTDEEREEYDSTFA